MSDKNYDINEHIRSSLKELDVQPRESSFEALMQKLEKKRKRRFFILFFFGVLVMGSAVYIMSSALAPVKAKEVSLSVTPAVKTGYPEKMNSPISRKKTNSLKETPADLPATATKTTTEKNIFPGENTTPVNASIPTAATFVSSAGNNNDNSSNTRINPSESVAASLSGPTPVSPHLALDSATALIKAPELVFLDQKPVVLPDSTPRELDPAVTTILPGPFMLNKNSFLKKKHSFKLLAGVSLNPQLGSYVLSGNKQASPIYNTTTTLNTDAASFQEQYLQNKKEQNRFYFNYALGIKLGIIMDDKWELWLTGGVQRYYDSEEFYKFIVPGKTPTGPTHQNLNTAVALNTAGRHKMVYRYLLYSAECNRIFGSFRSLRLKAGAGLSINNLRSARYAYVYAPDVYYFNSMAAMPFLSKTIYTIHLNGGIIKDFGRRLQLRVSPRIFYSPTSLFDKTYVIKQRSYGLELECMLAFKLF